MISNIILSISEINPIIEEDVLRCSTLSLEEFYQVAIDATIYSIQNKDSVDNYLYYWAFARSNEVTGWRMTIPSVIMNHISRIIKSTIVMLRLDNPVVLDVLSKSESSCLVRLHKHFIVLSF